MPYYEQNTQYEFLTKYGMELTMQCDQVTGVRHSGSAPVEASRYLLWWDTLTQEQKNSLGSIPIWKCPSRRSGVQLVTQFVRNSDSGAGAIPANGPVTDYTAVVLWSDAIGATVATSIWTAHFSSTDAAHANNNFGPFRVSRHNGGNTDANTPRDSISYWADGTSNQIIFGEAHVPINRKNVCVAANWWTQADCGALTGNGGSRAYARAVHPAYRLARGPNDYTGDSSGHSPITGYGFGSYHTGTCNFLFGDGSVHSVNTTVSMSSILVPLANVGDGAAVSLP
jgi:prepilin-type processing-associated H-X9-DG protein